MRMIPKKKNLEKVSDCRPISLIGSIYKVISKVLANRLKKAPSGIWYHISNWLGISTKMRNEGIDHLHQFEGLMGRKRAFIKRIRVICRFPVTFLIASKRSVLFSIIRGFSHPVSAPVLVCYHLRLSLFTALQSLLGEAESATGNARV
ncbi:unnamed protein product [Vicia faba]|uniref:Uncharacterized protein n=1 Tax=Vicia faba TaxID=3906 RepID=A0AAV0ZYV3_VICFA|nr:unnamed protein product [Vicia faba]